MLLPRMSAKILGVVAWMQVSLGAAAAIPPVSGGDDPRVSIRGVPPHVLDYVVSFDGLYGAELERRHPGIAELAYSQQIVDALRRWLTTPDAQEEQIAEVTAGVLRHLRTSVTTADTGVVRSYLGHPNWRVRLRAFEAITYAYFRKAEHRDELLALLQRMFEDTNELVSRQAVVWTRGAGVQKDLEHVLRRWYETVTPAEHQKERHELVGKLLNELNTEQPDSAPHAPETGTDRPPEKDRTGSPTSSTRQPSPVAPAPETIVIAKPGAANVLAEHTTETPTIGPAPSNAAAPAAMRQAAQAPPSSGGDTWAYLVVSLGAGSVIGAISVWLFLRKRRGV